MIKNLDELAKFVKGGADVLQKAIKSEDEVSLELVDGSFVSDSDLESLKEKQFNSGKKEGQTIGYDFAMKDVKKDFNLEIEGKDRGEILKSIKQKIMNDAKIEPDKKITELNDSLEKLRNQYQTEEEVWKNEKSRFENQLKDIKIMSELQRNVPEVKGLKPNHFATLARTEYEFDFDETGRLIASKNGQPLRDKMENPIPVKNILTDYATQNGWTGENGRNGRDNFGGSSNEFKSINDVYGHMEKNGIDPMSTEGEELINKFEKSKD